jgi:hypothetical protein
MNNPRLGYEADPRTPVVVSNRIDPAFDEIRPVSTMTKEERAFLQRVWGKDAGSCSVCRTRLATYVKNSLSSVAACNPKTSIQYQRHF